MSRRVGPLCLGLATGALAAGYGLEGHWGWTAVIGLLGTIWLFGFWQCWPWLASVSLVGFAVTAAAGIWLEVGAGWMVLGLIAALCGWDLHRFSLILGSVERIEAQRELEQQHLLRLLAVFGLGSLLAATSLTIEIRLSFLPALLLGVLAVWGLNRAVHFLRREGD
jgi:hypothetical protein